MKSFIFSLLLVLFSGQSIWAKSVSESFAELQEKIRLEPVDARSEIAPLIFRLKSTTSPSDRDALLSGLVDLGRFDSRYPRYIKAYIREELPAVALAIAQDGSVSWATRGKAITLLGAIDASEVEIRKAIEIARNDQSKERDYIASRGRIMQDYLYQRQRGGGNEFRMSPPEDSQKERKALEILRTRSLKPTFDSLLTSVAVFEPIEVEALLDAGAFTFREQNRVQKGEMEVWVSMMTGCHDAHRQLEQFDATVAKLLAGGLDINSRDQLNNSPLLHAGQFCPLIAVRSLIERGAKVGVMNAQGVTELSMAIFANRWDVASYLVEHGSRLPKKTMENLFIEPPSEPEKLAIIAKGTSK